MLAERTSNTQVQLPEELQSRAVVLVGEMAWAAPDALRVVEWLSSHGATVLGAELWREKNGKPQWIETGQGFYETPAASAREAIRFIAEFQDCESHPGNLFNVSWSTLPSVETMVAEAA